MIHQIPLKLRRAQMLEWQNWMFTIQLVPVLGDWYYQAVIVQRSLQWHIFFFTRLTYSLLTFRFLLSLGTNVCYYQINSFLLLQQQLHFAYDSFLLKDLTHAPMKLQFLNQVFKCKYFYPAESIVELVTSKLCYLNQYSPLRKKKGGVML